MSVKIGKLAYVTIYNKIVAQSALYSLSGFAREATEVTSFQDDIKKFVFSSGDSGEIYISSYYDPDDVNGQSQLDSSCSNSEMIEPNDIRFYIDAEKYFTVDTGGYHLVTKCRAVKLEKSSLGLVDFTVRVSGKAMVLIDEPIYYIITELNEDYMITEDDYYIAKN